MNIIHKIVWSRCRNAFVVASETASSHSSTGRATPVSVSALSTLAAGIGLALGLSAPALAIEEAKPQDSVWVITGTSTSIAADITNTAYGNALLIKNADGITITSGLNGHSYKVTPTAPDENRIAGDIDPYAAIMLNNAKNVKFNSGITLSVIGERLHGVVMDSESDLISNDVTIFAEGDGSTGMLMEGGSAQVFGGDITVAGDYSAWGIDASHEAFISLDGTNISATGYDAQGVSVGDDSQAEIVDVTIVVNQSGVDEYGVGIDVYGASNATVDTSIITVNGESAQGMNLTSSGGWDPSIATVRDTSIAVNGTSSLGVGTFRSLLNLYDSTLEANGNDAIGLDLYDNSLGDVKDTAIAVSGDDSIGVRVEKTSDILLEDSEVIVDAGNSEAKGILVEDSYATLARSKVKASGDIAYGVSLTGSASATITNSELSVDGGFYGAGVSVRNGGSVEISDSTIRTSGGFMGHGIAVENGNVVLKSTRIDAIGSLNSEAVHMRGGSTFTASDQTELASSGHGVSMQTISGLITADLTDTKIVTDGATLRTEHFGDGRYEINLGEGVVATNNNGTLLEVLRMVSPEGRTDLNLTNGATVSGKIFDWAGSLADLAADGGTYLTLRDANYAGTVTNVRSINIEDGARIGGGSLATPNTVFEDVSVDDAVFTGNWTIGGTLTANNGARIAPGNSIGVITTAAINWGPGTIYEVEINDAGDSDRTNVTGPAGADISKTTLHVIQENGNGGYRLNHEYTILDAVGGVDGEFIDSAWLGNNDLLTLKTIYDDPNAVRVSLAVDTDALNASGFTSNQRSAAGGAASVTGLNAAADAAFLSTKPASSFDMLSGEIHPSTRAGLMNSSALLSNAVLGRLRDNQPVGDPALAGKASATYPLWISYAHSKQTAKGDSNSARRKHKVDSFSLGADAELDAGWTVGGAFSYAKNDINLKARRSSSDIDSYGLALYVGNSWEQNLGVLNLMVGLGHSWHDINTRRDVDLGGSQTLKASYDARTTQVFGELGYAMPVGPRSVVEPYLGLNWLQHRSDSFSESGGPAALKGARGKDDVTFSTLGLRAATTFDSGSTVWGLQGGLGWRHALGDRQPAAKLAFIQGGGDNFKIVGAPIARNAAVFDIGAEAHIGRNTTVGLGYEGQAGDGFKEHAGHFYLKTRF